MTELQPFTLGTHNLLDGTGRATPFADLILFTEFPVTRLRRARALATLTRHGYFTVTDRRQPDLVIAARRRLFKRRGKTYEHVVDGRAKVTPNRGTLVGLIEQRRTLVAIGAVCEHRINAWYPPFKRGEPEFRAAAWRRHEIVTGGIIRRLQDSGYETVAGGDPNAPKGIDAYELTNLREVGGGLDRLAARRIGHAFLLGAMGSDHPRLRATVR